MRNMKDLRNGQDPLLEAWEGASPIGLPDLPEVFFEEMRRHFRLDGSGRLLVLWCGAGVFVPLAESFESILIADPEPDRLAEARRDAKRMGIHNAILLKGGPELLHPRMGRFRLVIVQDAFLRRDRMRRLSFLARMTEPEGGAVVAEVHRCGLLNRLAKGRLGGASAAGRKASRGKNHSLPSRGAARTFSLPAGEPVHSSLDPETDHRPDGERNPCGIVPLLQETIRRGSVEARPSKSPFIQYPGGAPPPHRRLCQIALQKKPM